MAPQANNLVKNRPILEFWKLRMRRMTSQRAAVVAMIVGYSGGLQIGTKKLKKKIQHPYGPLYCSTFTMLDSFILN